MATQVALLNANYLMKLLDPHYKILYKNENGMCAHEFIIDLRPFAAIGIEGIDVAKRLHVFIDNNRITVSTHLQCRFR